MIRFAKKPLLALLAASLALGTAAPASADRGHHGRYAHHHGKYYHGAKYYGHRGHRAHGRYYYGSRHYRRHHHRGGLSGGEAALIAAGIIGGIILIDRAIERDRAYDRYYDDYRYRSPRYGSPRYGSRSSDFRYRRDDRAGAGYGPDYDDYADDELAGGPQEYAARSTYNHGAAYNDCKAETRAAALDSGVIVALPASPDYIEELDRGAAVRFTASLIAQDPSGGEVRRDMICEADAEGVRYLEIV